MPSSAAQVGHHLGHPHRDGGVPRWVCVAGAEPVAGARAEELAEPQARGGTQPERVDRHAAQRQRHRPARDPPDVTAGPGCGVTPAPGSSDCGFTPPRSGCRR